MPGKARIGEADMLAVLIPDIGDQQDFGKTGQQIFLDDVDFELSEPGAEFDVPLVGQLLPAKHDDDIVVEGALDLAECRIVDVLREIEVDFRAAGRAAFLHRRPHRALLRAATPEHARSPSLRVLKP